MALIDSFRRYIERGEKKELLLRRLEAFRKSPDVTQQECDEILELINKHFGDDENVQCTQLQNSSTGRKRKDTKTTKA